MERQKLVSPLCKINQKCVIDFRYAVEQLSMALEDERELVKATKKKNLNIIKDLQKQLQSSKRFEVKARLTVVHLCCVCLQTYREPGSLHSL